MYSPFIITEAVNFQDFMQRFSFEFNLNSSFQFVHMLTELFKISIIIVVIVNNIIISDLGISILSH